MMLAIIEEWIRPFKHHLLTINFIAGFVIDNLTLNRVDQVFDNVVLLGHVLIATFSLILLYAATAGRLPERIAPKVRTYAPLAMQFSFGGLLSGVLVFYSRSGSWWTSWPFLLVIVGIIFGNEFIKNRAQRLVFNISVLFIGIFSYLVLIFPVLIGKMGADIFLLSGIAAVGVISLVIKALKWIVPNFMMLNMRRLVFTVGMIYALLNGLYFANFIPPIPLSLKEIGIYHNVERLESGTYRLTYEEGSWFNFWKDSDTTFHYVEGDTAFCFASVFAPTKIETNIYHRWQYYDDVKNEWIDHARLSYPIAGGRGNGFRGYTSVERLRDGLWRCIVETSRGQVVGEEEFKVEKGVPPKGLVTIIE